LIASRTGDEEPKSERHAGRIGSRGFLTPCLGRPVHLEWRNRSGEVCDGGLHNLRPVRRVFAVDTQSFRYEDFGASRDQRGRKVRPTNPVSELHPEPGDVIFIRRRDLRAHGSIAVQLLTDPYARGSGFSASHVAVVINPDLAIEAMPAEGALDETIGAWTGVPLHYGVRIIPVGDIVVPERQNRRIFSVLRSPKALPPIDDLFGLNSQLLQEILGSEFSVDPLKRAVTQKLKTPFGIGQAKFDRLLNFIAKKVRSTSKARDISADAGVSLELKKELTRIAPGYEFPFEPQTFYCSLLALRVLELAGAITTVEPTPSTPTGMRAFLHNEGWKDVTPKCYSNTAIDRYAVSEEARQSAEAEYFSGRASIHLRRLTKIIAEQTDFAKKGFAPILERTNKMRDEAVAMMVRSLPQNKTPPSDGQL
jgi:hypothetical protein